MQTPTFIMQIFILQFVHWDVAWDYKTFIIMHGLYTKATCFTIASLERFLKLIIQHRPRLIRWYIVNTVTILKTIEKCLLYSAFYVPASCFLLPGRSQNVFKRKKYKASKKLLDFTT